MFESVHFFQFFMLFLLVVVGIGIVIIAFYLKQKRKASLNKNLEHFNKSYALGEINKSDLDELKRDLLNSDKSSQNNSD